MEYTIDWGNHEVVFGYDFAEILAQGIENWLDAKMDTVWRPFEEYGCYYRLSNGVLLACPMLLNGEMESEESACDVDFFSIDEEIATQARHAETILRCFAWRKIWEQWQ